MTHNDKQLTVKRGRQRPTMMTTATTRTAITATVMMFHRLLLLLALFAVFQSSHDYVGSISAYSPSSGSKSRPSTSLPSSSSQQQQQQQQQRQLQRRAFLVKGLTTIVSSTAIITTARHSRHDGRAGSDNAFGLDMDAFANSQIEADKKNCDPKRDPKCAPKLSEDEALCRFGSPTPATGQACVRAGLSPSRPGGVDAFGKIDRGGFVKCKPVYEREDPNGPKGMLMKEWRCE